MAWERWLGQCEPQQSKCIKPWIRYERKHSLSMVHLDYTSNHDGKKVYVCVVLDDSLRRILAGGEFDSETTDNTLQHLREASQSPGCKAVGIQFEIKTVLFRKHP
jgi:hypothetical protein